MWGSNVVREEHKAAAREALAAAGHTEFERIGFSRSVVDTATRGAFVSKGGFYIFAAPDDAPPDVRKATDESAEERVREMLAELEDKVQSPLEAPVEAQTQAEFDYTPTAAGGSDPAPDVEPEDDESPIDKALSSLRAMNALLAPLVAPPHIDEPTSLEQEFLKSLGAKTMTPAHRIKYAQYVRTRLDQQLSALERARASL